MDGLLLFAGALFAIIYLHTSMAMIIEGKQMAIDEAIIKAGANTSMSRMFDIMEDKNTVKVELDMLYKMETYTQMRKEMEDASTGNRRMKRKALASDSRKWPNARVPYEIDNHAFSASDRQIIMSAIKDYHRFTCIRFVPARNEKSKIVFQKRGGCYSFVGMISGPQPISLGNGCRHKGIVIHEMGHAIGFQHEQTRPDRDDFVDIYTDNILSGLSFNFNKYPESEVNDYNVKYDYTSVMHYSQYAFSRNDKITIRARQPEYQEAMGNREGLSYRDIQLANIIYKCGESCREGKCSQGFRGPQCKCWCDSGDRGNPLKECDGSAEPVNPVISTAAPITCEDKNQYCSQWATSGLCTGEYEAYMTLNCPLSCNTCSRLRTTAATTTSTTTKSSASSNCIDDSRYCEYWANMGECERNPFYMSANCKKSCNACGTMPEVCRDIDTERCPGWVSYCNNDVYKTYLSMNCKKSCNLCTARDVARDDARSHTTNTPEPVDKPEVSADCYDMKGSTACKKYERKCNRSLLVMKLCAKTCGAC